MAVALANTGKALIAGRLAGVSNEPKWIGWGTGTNAPAATDTALQTPASEDRQQGSTTRVTTTVTNDTYKIVGTVQASGSKTITEVGFFDAQSGGNLFARGTHTGVAVTADDAIEYTLTVQF